MSQDIDFTRLKEIRQELGWSLRDLAAKTDVSPSYLSLIERGRTVPTLPKIHRICNALGISIGHFVDDVPPSPRVTAEQHESATFHDSYARVTILASPRDSAVSMFLFEIEPVEVSSDRMITHPYPEYGYVIEGQLKVVFDDEVVIASKGDTVRVEAGRPHRFLNPGTTQSVSVWSAPTYGDGIG